MKSTCLFWISLIFLAGILVMGCDKPGQIHSEGSFDRQMYQQLPRVLIITTGLEGQNATLPKGIVIALQAFNKTGAVVRLEPRDILNEPERMKTYNIIILSTAPGYHDADRKYSLSFMSLAQMENLNAFVEEGGVLISGDNVGRNKLDGTDRIAMYRRLSPEVYPLASSFGLMLTERNMEGYEIFGQICGEQEDYIRPPAGDNFYTPVPDTIISQNIDILARWVKEEDTLPAIVKNRYGKGTAYLLASSDFLHPAGEGGFMSTQKISRFYESVINDFHQQNLIPIRVNPWPQGHPYAFCLSLNAGGNLTQYENTLKMINKHNIPSVIFVDGKVDPQVMRLLQKDKVHIESRGHAFTNYRNLNYAQAIQDMYENENHWQKKFSGFRFPFTMPGFWGLVALSEKEYEFESSIGANNLEFIHGSVAPHNIVLAHGGFYRTTDIIELSPTYHDDYYFFKDLPRDKRQRERAVVQQTRLYDKYLENFMELAVKPYSGLMVFQGHPQYVGMNDTTLQVLENTIIRAKQDDAWIASAREIAAFRKNLLKVAFYVQHDHDQYVIYVDAPQGLIQKGVTLNLGFRPQKVSAKRGKVQTISDDDHYQVVFDALKGQVITVKYD